MFPKPFSTDPSTARFGGDPATKPFSELGVDTKQFLICFPFESGVADCFDPPPNP